MKNRSKKKKKSNVSPVTRKLGCIAVLLMFLLVMLILITLKGPKEVPAVVTEPSETTVATTVAEESTEPTETETTVPEETTPPILPHLAEMAAKNSDMIGWIQIAGTKLDYPLMYSSEDNEKYLHKDINGIFSIGGLPYVDSKCSIDPRSDNWVIYGHNMKNGTQFRTLMQYEKKSFWKENPVIHLCTLYEEKEYEIMAAFYDRIYYRSENVFKFYQFIDAEDEEDFNYAVKQFKKKSIYDTGITAEYGDHLITLVTCTYNEQNGRFVVVAREVPPETPPVE